MDREIERDTDRVIIKSGTTTPRDRGNTGAASGAIGSVMESLGGIAAIVLGILGLDHMVPQTLAGVGIIVVGAALVSEGSALLGRYARIANDDAAGFTTGYADIGGGVMLEFLAGIAAIVLGVLALLSISPLTLMAIAIIAIGAALILAGGSFGVEAPAVDTGDLLARNALMGTRSIEMLAGVGAVVLGILALLGHHELTLILVSILGLGAAIVLTGSALTGRLLMIMNR